MFVLEGIAVIATYQIFFPIECHATGIAGLCRGLRIVFISAICVFAAFAVLICGRTRSWHRFLELIKAASRKPLWGNVHLLGVMVIFLPVLIIPPGEVNEKFLYVFILLAGGGALAALGSLFWVLRPLSWWEWLGTERFQPLVILLLAALIPSLAHLIEPLWAVEFVSTATFKGVALLLSAVGPEVFIEPGRAWIGLPGFVVAVASQCSGIEGFALITGFMVIYAVLFRETLRQNVFWLVLWPIALLASWVFNILRITVLILIGRYVSPELAVNGFHSFAGWLLFIFLALGILYLAQAIPALRRVNYTLPEREKLSADPVAALIVPFIAFMISGVIAHAFWENPALGYPFQAAVMLGVLVWMRRALFPQIRLSLDPFSIAAGLVVGAAWVWFSEPYQEDDLVLGALSGSAFLAWAMVRTLGTTLLVPVVEEAFFRGYILARLDTGSPAAKAIAVLVSTALFAALHGRLILAGIAGLLFAAAMLRRGRLGDAVVAHIVANASVAAVAWYSGQWSLI
ncbi:exosortase E/protease, VPEID-CTERM system [Leisingera methylohalidivorans]|uniref:exosortase E/protease, VPEID-CTERM system n=1 Tax=Leisingera methylohalidivorans TaxID=133924 RepID=UPI00146FA1A3|nr:exosortase E/protease, VPEID-CTERM system [Leisingera methylohalidivorans]